MKDAYRTALKHILCEQIGSTRISLELTQDKMAESLMIDVRSYADIDRGISMCGTLTFVLFLLQYCKDTAELLRKIQDAFDDLSKSM